MAESHWYTRPAISASIFAVTFISCVIGLPLIGFLLLLLLAPIGLGILAALIMFFPGYMLLLGNLKIGSGPDADWVFGSEGYHFIPLTVWLTIWATFTWVAKDLSPGRQYLAAFGTIVAVTLGVHLVLATCRIRMYLELW